MCVRETVQVQLFLEGLLVIASSSVFLRSLQGYKKVLEMSLFACLYFDSDKSVSVLQVNVIARI